MNENAQIQAERKRLQKEWLEGVDEGYYGDLNRIPEFARRKLAVNWTCRERGFYFGRALRLQEERGSA